MAALTRMEAAPICVSIGPSPLAPSVHVQWAWNFWPMGRLVLFRKLFCSSHIERIYGVSHWRRVTTMLLSR